MSPCALAGQLSAADLPPEGGGPQEELYDTSIDVFPRLHEKDPYRCLRTGCACCAPHSSCALALSAVHARARRRLGVAHDSSFEEVQDARNYLYEVRWLS